MNQNGIVNKKNPTYGAQIVDPFSDAQEVFYVSGRQLLS